MVKPMAIQAEQVSATRATGRATTFGVVLVLLVLSAALLANGMTKPVSRDEHMYCTAGVLMARGQAIYRDFSYPSQLPYHPLMLAALYRVFQTQHYLLVARLVSVTCEILVLVCILGIYRTAFGSRREGPILGALAAVMYVFNPLVEYAGGYAWNHSVVVLCVMLSLWLLITTDFEKRARYAPLALIGALLTLATCMRITTALVEAFFLVAIVIVARGSVRNRVYAALPFSLAAFIISLWPISVAVRAGAAFWLNLLRIPALYGQWLHEIGMVHSKVGLTIAAFLTPAYFLLLVLACCLFFFLVRRRRSLTAQTRTTAAIAGLLPLVFFVIAYIPPTMWRQYLAIPVPFVLTALAFPLAAVCVRTDEPTQRGPSRFAWAAVSVCAAATALANVGLLSRCIAVLAPEYWVPTVLHRTSTDIAGQTAQPQPALTLGPLYALEGGGDIYPELSCGAVVYRVADSLSAEERALTHTVGLETLASLVQEHPPAAVILGVEPSYFAFLETPLRNVVGPDWQRETYEDGIYVYVRP